MNAAAKRAVTWKRMSLYIWLGLAYLCFRLVHDLVDNTSTFWPRVVNNIWLLCYVTVLNYFLFEFTLPFIKWRWKRLLVTPFLLFLHLILYSYGLYAWRAAGIASGIYTALITHASLDEGVTYHVPFSIASIFVFAILKHIYDYRKLRIATQQLRIEKQEAELNYLKSQTNPHFLFNTLNNIYALAREKSDLAPESILRLSKILRFMLYETGGGYIPIEQEIRIISDYIELEKLRHDESLRVQFSSDLENMKQAIPPLLLIPLVENAFKHGVSETRTDPFVNLHLAVSGRVLTFTVKNSVEGETVDQPAKENIGLANLRRQLELLYREHELTVFRKQNEFTALLKINLASHVNDQVYHHRG